VKELYNGAYIRRLNRKTFPNGSSFIEISSFCPSKNDTWFVNNRYRISLEEVQIYSEDEYQEAIKESFRVKRQEVEIIEVKDENDFNKGRFVRYVDWGFFDSTNLPVVEIDYFTYKNNNVININGFDFNINQIVNISKKEADKIIEDYNNQKISKGSSSVRSCVNKYRRLKLIWTEESALKFVYSYNKKYPAAKLKYYRCDRCGEIHIGHLNEKRHGKTAN
jgi:hypothetical protein